MQCRATQRPRCVGRRRRVLSAAACGPCARRRRPALGASLAVSFSLLYILVTALLVLASQRIAGEQVRSRIGGNLAELACQTTSRLDRS